MNEKNRTFFMKKALHQAHLALKNDEVPIGAIIVGPNNQVLAKAYNKVEKTNSQTSHAEILAIQKACKKLGNWRLNGCWIYVTLEPCLMCFGLIQLSRLDGIIFGSKSTLFGAGLKDIEELPQFAKNLKIKWGIMEKECLEVLKIFFKKLRKKRKECGETEKRAT